MQKTLLAVLASTTVVFAFTGPFASATHEPADKVSAAGSTAEVVAPNENVTLLSEKVRTANPTDLMLQATAECTITTELTTVGNDFQTADGFVRVWVEIDGKRVPVSSDDTDDPGKVSICSKMEERETTLFDDEDATIRTLSKQGTASGFNWMALNVGSGIHTIELKADLQTNASDNAQALAAVGKRTLLVEPTKATNDETVTDLAS